EVTEGDGIWWCERHQCRWGYAPDCGWSPRGEACPKSRRLLIEWEADGVAAPSFLAARGSVPNNNGRSATDIVRELREKATDTLLHVLYLGSDRSQLGSTQVRMHERAADAVLRLVAEHLGGKE